MSLWFRHYRGMMRDEKLVRVAVKSKQPIERVLWVWSAILESACEVEDHGRFDFDAAEAAYFLRVDESDIRDILSALDALARISDGVVVKWADRQFDSDKSRDRQKRYRDRRKSLRDGELDNSDGVVTSRDGEVTLQEPEPDTEPDISSEPIGSSDSTPPPENSDRSSKPETPVEPEERDEPRLAFEAYNAAASAVGWPIAKTLNAARRASLKRRLAEAGGLDGWTSALGRARASPFLTGANDRGWRADLDFFLQAKSFNKLVEGGYDARTPAQQTPNRNTPRQRIASGEANLIAAFTGGDRTSFATGRGIEPYTDFAAGFDDGRTLDLVAAHR